MILDCFRFETKVVLFQNLCKYFYAIFIPTSHFATFFCRLPQNDYLYVTENNLYQASKR